MDSHFGFNALVAIGQTDEEALQLADTAALAIGLSRVGVEPKPFLKAKYRDRGAQAEVALTFQSTDRYFQFGIYPVYHKHFEAIGEDRMAQFLEDLCLRFRVKLGRSFKEDLHATVYESELENGVEYVDWFQFWDMTIVSKWGVDYLKGGPFWRVRVFDGLGCAIVLTESPYGPDEREATRRAATYLGMRLRPRLIRDTNGQMVEVKWP